MKNRTKKTFSNNRGGRGFKRSNFDTNSKNTKNGKPDKTKGLESHTYDIGKSEYYVKITDFMLSYIRQEYELGNDIASAIENGE